MAVVSMTGFGRARGVLSERLSASLVVRSVNHRYLDVVVRTGVREELPEAEAVVRKTVSDVLARGRVTVQLNLERTAPAGARPLVDHEAVAAVLRELRDLETREGWASAVGVGDVISLPGLVTVSAEETALTEDELTGLGRVAEEAVAQLDAMRREEGARLVEQIVAERERIAEFLGWFQPQMATIRTGLLERLRERLAELLGPDHVADPDRLAQEAALLADRGDVAEEVVRLGSHLDQLDRRLGEGGTVGRALDFLCQEMNRELNTMTSKCREAGVTERLVDARTAAERIREQVQNLE